MNHNGKRARRAVRRGWVLVAALGLVVALGSAGVAQTSDTTTTVASGSGSSSASLKSLVAKAEAEGELNLDYLSPDPEIQAMIAAFNKTYPDIKVNYRGGAALGAQLNVLEQSEIQGKKAGFDAFITANAGDFTVWKQNGWALPLSKSLPVYNSLPEGWANDDYVTMYQGIYAVAYNTDVISKADVPKSYASLTKSKYSGKLGIPNPSNTSVRVADWALYNNSAIGPKWFKGVAKNKPQLFTSGVDETTALAAGQIGIGLLVPTNIAATNQDKGAPIALAPLKGTPTYTGVMAVYNKAEHPNAALLFANWMLTSKDADAVLRTAQKVGPLSISLSDLAVMSPYLKGFKPSMFSPIPQAPIDGAAMNAIAEELGFE